MPMTNRFLRSPFKLKKSFLLQAFLISAAALAVYAGAVSDGFVHDDNDQILNNPWIRDFSHFKEIFTQNVWGFREGSLTNYYRPVMHLSYMLEYHLFGPDPRGFHLVNILVHSINSVLVFLLSSKIYNAFKKGSQSPFSVVPFAAGLLFALDPIHTEAVIWVACLPELLLTLFFLLSLYLYLESEKPDGTSNRGILALSAASYGLALLSKETAITLPLVLIVWDFLVKKRPFRLMRYLPFALSTLADLFLRYNALGFVKPVNIHNYLNASQMAATTLSMFVHYLLRLALPFNLNALWTFHPIMSPFGLIPAAYLLITLLILSLGLVAWKKDRAVLFAFFLLLLPLAPALYIAAIEFPFAERYLYLPSFGFLLAFSLLTEKIPPQKGRLFLMAFVPVVLATSFSIGTVNRNRVWKNDITYWEDAAAKDPDDDYLISKLGMAYLKHRQYGNAAVQFEKLFKIGKVTMPIRVNLGVAYAATGRLDDAIRTYKDALKIEPTYSLTHFELGNALVKKGDISAAISEFRQASSLNPYDEATHYNLAMAYQREGRDPEAIEELKVALDLNPRDADSYNNLGVEYARLKKYNDSAACFREALRLNPDSAEFRANLDEASKVGNKM